MRCGFAQCGDGRDSTATQLLLLTLTARDTSQGRWGEGVCVEGGVKGREDGEKNDNMAEPQLETIMNGGPRPSLLLTRVAK